MTRLFSTPHVPTRRLPGHLWFRSTLTVALLIGCAAGLPEPTPLHLAAARQREPSATLEDLSRGRSRYISKCGGCHALRDPGSLSADAWQHEVDEMKTKQGVNLDDRDSRDILRYLSASSQVAGR